MNYRVWLAAGSTACRRYGPCNEGFADKCLFAFQSCLMEVIKVMNGNLVGWGAGGMKWLSWLSYRHPVVAKHVHSQFKKHYLKDLKQ